jgi:hypothetical protein
MRIRETEENFNMATTQTAVTMRPHITYRIKFAITMTPHFSYRIKFAITMTPHFSYRIKFRYNNETSHYL